jgi:hypothetical protein
MFNDTPGFLSSLSIDVNDASTWEIEDGLQFPKYITCQCSFTCVGKYLPSTLGKHYELPWLEDKGWDSSGNKGTFQPAVDIANPSRVGKGDNTGEHTGMYKIFDNINAPAP